MDVLPTFLCRRIITYQNHLNGATQSASSITEIVEESVKKIVNNKERRVVYGVQVIIASKNEENLSLDEEY
jgi:hypothetical protein